MTCRQQNTLAWVVSAAFPHLSDFGKRAVWDQGAGRVAFWWAVSSCLADSQLPSVLSPHGLCPWCTPAASSFPQQSCWIAAHPLTSSTLHCLLEAPSPYAGTPELELLHRNFGLGKCNSSPNKACPCVGLQFLKNWATVSDFFPFVYFLLLGLSVWLLEVAKIGIIITWSPVSVRQHGCVLHVFSFW